jgi:hypothetical protein
MSATTELLAQIITLGRQRVQAAGYRPAQDFTESLSRAKIVICMFSLDELARVVRLKLAWCPTARDREDR